MSHKLINEYPLLVLPSLAKEIGLNEAIVLQQIHFWLETFKKANDVKHLKHGRWWVYNSVKQWKRDNFPFWSVNTIERVIRKLEDRGLLISDVLNAAKFDQTKWYTIDYERLEQIVRFPQNGEIDNTNLGEPIPETTTETTKAKNENNVSRKPGEQVAGSFGGGSDNLLVGGADSHSSPGHNNTNTSEGSPNEMRKPPQNQVSYENACELAQYLMRELGYEFISADNHDLLTRPFVVWGVYKSADEYFTQRHPTFKVWLNILLKRYKEEHIGFNDMVRWLTNCNQQYEKWFKAQHGDASDFHHYDWSTQLAVDDTQVYDHIDEFEDLDEFENVDDCENLLDDSHLELAVQAIEVAIEATKSGGPAPKYS
jgi:hypothetical protein